MTSSAIRRHQQTWFENPQTVEKFSSNSSSEMFQRHSYSNVININKFGILPEDLFKRLLSIGIHLARVYCEYLCFKYIISWSHLLFMSLPIHRRVDLYVSNSDWPVKLDLKFKSKYYYFQARRYKKVKLKLNGRINVDISTR